MAATAATAAEDLEVGVADVANVVDVVVMAAVVEGNNLEVFHPTFRLIDPDNDSIDAHGDAVAGAQRSFVLNTLRPGEVRPDEMETDQVCIRGNWYPRQAVKDIDEALARQAAAVEDSYAEEASLDARADSEDDGTSPKSPPPEPSNYTRYRTGRSSGHNANGSNARRPARSRAPHPSAAGPNGANQRAFGPHGNRSNGRGPHRNNGPRPGGLDRYQPYPLGLSGGISAGRGPSGLRPNQHHSLGANLSGSKSEDEKTAKMNAALDAIANEGKRVDGPSKDQVVTDPRRRRRRPARQ